MDNTKKLYLIYTIGHSDIVGRVYRILRPDEVLCMDIDHMKIMEDTGFAFIKTMENYPRKLLCVGTKPGGSLKQTRPRTMPEWNYILDMIKELKYY